MAILAIGTDIVDLERLRQVWQKHPKRFLGRHFTQSEIEYCLAKTDPLPSLGARFAAKEAFQKCWLQSFGWRDVWVEMEGVKPRLEFAPKLKQKMLLEGWVAHISLSHERGHATAMALLEKP